MEWRGELRGDGLDLHPGQLLAVTHGAMVALPAAIFVGDELLAFELLDDFTGEGAGVKTGSALTAASVTGLRLSSTTRPITTRPPGTSAPAAGIGARSAASFRGARGVPSVGPRPWSDGAAPLP